MTEPRTISPDKAKCCAESRTTIEDFNITSVLMKFKHDISADILQIFRKQDFDTALIKQIEDTIKEQLKDLLRRRIKELDEEIGKWSEIMTGCIQCSDGIYCPEQHLRKMYNAEGARAELERLLGKKEELK